MRTVMGFAFLTATGALLTRAWIPMVIFFAVATFTPELAARLHGRRFYRRGHRP